MTKFIIHRINKISNLKKLKKYDGIEFDVRDRNNKLILSHDPNNNGEELNKFIKNGIKLHVHIKRGQNLH